MTKYITVKLTEDQHQWLVNHLEDELATAKRARYWFVVRLLETLTGEKYGPDHSGAEAIINRKLAEGKLKFPDVKK